MNNLTKTLLGSVALSTMAIAAAAAQQSHPAFHFTAMHGGRAVNKTARPSGRPCRDCYRYTFFIYSYEPASAPPHTPLAQTFYRWNSNSTLCSHPKTRIKGPKRSVYAKISYGTETYSMGCPSGPTQFYGAFWTNKTGKAGDIDSFGHILIGKFQNSHGEYKGKLQFVTQITIQ